jgi:hypothetical protein
MAAVAWGLCFFALPAPGKYGGGSGEPNDPYLIYTDEQMNAIGADANDWDKHFRLMADIDLVGLTGTSFNIIGYHEDFESPNNIPFTGVFDGGGHTISNFTYEYSGDEFVGLFGYVSGQNTLIKNLGLIDPNVDAGGDYVGSLVAINVGTISNCYAEGGCVSGGSCVGGLVGFNWSGTITNSHSAGIVLGNASVGGLVGYNYFGKIMCCNSSGSVFGTHHSIGGLVGWNYGTINKSFSEGNVSGKEEVGGLVGENRFPEPLPPPHPFGSTNISNSKGAEVTPFDPIDTFKIESGDSIIMGDYTSLGEAYSYNSTITNCYSTGGLSGQWCVGGLVGYSYDYVGNTIGYAGLDETNSYCATITDCYSTCNVSGDCRVGGLVAINSGSVSASFWDIETSKRTVSGGGSGKTTAEMQTMSTFTDAGWDFKTPIWTIDEGVDYPRLCWEIPILHAEPEITLGTSNTISWEPIVGAIEYYAECSEDANFTNIVYSTGWITETSYEFIGLELGKRYWYSVKARNAAGVETNQSNVESSLQCNLADAVDIELAPESLKNENLKDALLNKINVVLEMIDEGLYESALSKLENDILQKMDGCGETGEPDKNDWIITCEEQSQVYPLVTETIEYVKGLAGE